MALHLVAADVAVAVVVVQSERDVCLRRQRAGTQHRQAGRQLREVHTPATVRVEQRKQAAQHVAAGRVIVRTLLHARGLEQHREGGEERLLIQLAVAVSLPSEHLQRVHDVLVAQARHAAELLPRPRRASALVSCCRRHRGRHLGSVHDRAAQRGAGLGAVPQLELGERQPAVTVDDVSIAEALRGSGGRQVLRRHAHACLHGRIGGVHDAEHRRQVQLHLLQADVPVAVHVVQLEGGLDLCVAVAAAQDRQA